MNTFYHLHHQHQHHHHQEPIIIVTATRTPCSWSLFSSSFIIYSLDLLKLINVASKVPCKRTQHCWPTTPKIVGCYMFRPFAHLVACCWMLLRVVAQSLKPVKLFSQQLPTFLLFRDRRSVRSNVGSVCTALPTLLGPRTVIMHGLQRLMGFILPTMHRRSQHCWRNNVGSCCVRLHAA